MCNMRGLGHMTVDILGKAIFHIRVSPPIKRFDLPQRIVRAEPPYPLSFIAGSGFAHKVGPCRTFIAY